MATSVGKLLSSQGDDVAPTESGSMLLPSKDTLLDAAPAETVALAVPTEPNAKKAFFRHCTSRIIGSCAQQVKQDGRQRPPLSDKQKTTLTVILRELGSIDGLTPDFEQAIALKRGLEVVMDHPSTSMYQFPAPLPEIARAAYQRYEAEQWGNNDDLRDPDDISEDEPEPVSPPGHRRRSSTSTSGTSNPPTFTAIRRAPSTHTIYGTHGIMRRILVRRDGKIPSYRLDPTYTHPTANVFGHNNLEVGEWWPLQICALRDGAHGMRIGGICGSPTQGAYSIIVSGMYADLDADYGDKLYYSGSQSHDNTKAAVPIISNATKALIRSQQTGNSVRVLRTAGSDAKYCPSVGLRYDGLYVVVSQDLKTNKRGGAYMRFRLERMSEQKDIDRSRPTAQEKRDYSRVRSFY